MALNSRPLAAATLAIALALPTATSAQSFGADQREEIETIVREYLLTNPQIMQEVVAELEKRQALASAEKRRDAIQEYSELIFNSPRQVTLGNPKGDVTMVELFDYNCGYCKSVVSDVLNLIEGDPQLRVVLKEFPVLGLGSTQAAQVAIAVHMQDSSGGEKYLEFHQKLLGGRAPADKARALAVAKEIGLDMARLEKDMSSGETSTTIDETFTIAEAMGLNGTPSFVIGNEVIVGAVGLDSLKEKVSIARCGKPAC